MLNLKKKKSTKETHSSYWLGDWGNDSVILNDMNYKQRQSHDLYKLASAKRSIANFVSIITDQVIPVTFNVEGMSYTDGKSIVIGTDVVNPQDFDVVVGLSLHEGSHIKLTNFETMKAIQTDTDKSIIDKAVSLGVPNWAEVIKNLLNVVEDRRIDSYVFNKAPGYRNYYRAMYDRFFNSPIIDVALQSFEHRDETIDAYMFRIINIHNKHTDLSALKGLRKIFNLINLKKIDRINTTDEVLEIVYDIFDVMLDNIDENLQKKKESEKESEKESGGDGGDSEPRELSDEEFQDLLDSIDNPSPGDSNGKGTPQQIKLTDKQKELLKKKIEEQKEFLDGKIQKQSLSSENQADLEQIEHSGSEQKTAGTTINDGYGRYNGTKVIVVKKMTKELMVSNVFPIATVDYNHNLVPTYQHEIDNGIRIGKVLGRKLQLRGESRNTVYNRQKLGRIDKRMIASLGFGNENVFEFTEIDTYKKANLHISIDASGSMNGSKWSETLTNVTAICKAISMIANLEVQVTFRTTLDRTAYVILAYDSRVDKFSKIKKLFPSLTATGFTPEGLCFEAIMKDFLPASNDTDSFFVNISDGQPYFHTTNFSYSGRPAYLHTKQMVKKMENMGIKILSYFIDSYQRPVDGDFKLMYGASAVSIDLTNISQITKTVNKLFMNKKQ